MDLLKHLDGMTVDEILQEGDRQVETVIEHILLNKKIIVIKGDPNVGKTTAARTLLNVLLYKGALLEYYKSIYRKTDTLEGDFIARVIYKKTKVAICSGGDKLTQVKDNIRSNAECDVIVVTSRNFSTFDKVFQKIKLEICVLAKGTYSSLIKFVKRLERKI